MEALGGVPAHRSAAYTRLLAALAAFRRVHGHLDIPSAYRVPLPVAGTKQDPGVTGHDGKGEGVGVVDAAELWPEALHGFRLGPAVGRVRRAARAEQPPHSFVDSANRLGFRWQVYRVGGEELLPGGGGGDRDACSVEKGDSFVPNADAEVGLGVEVLRHRLQVAGEKRCRLRILAAGRGRGLTGDGHTDGDPNAESESTLSAPRREVRKLDHSLIQEQEAEAHLHWTAGQVVRALESYRSVFGAVNGIPRGFTVPADPGERHFPRALQGMELGHIVHGYLWGGARGEPLPALAAPEAGGEAEGEGLRGSGCRCRDSSFSGSGR